MEDIVELQVDANIFKTVSIRSPPIVRILGEIKTALFKKLLYLSTNRFKQNCANFAQKIANSLEIPHSMEEFGQFSADMKPHYLKPHYLKTPVKKKFLHQ